MASVVEELFKGSTMQEARIGLEQLLPDILRNNDHLGNVTVLAEDAWDHVRDWDRSVLQDIWDLRHGHEDILRSPLFTVCLSVFGYFICCAPFVILDTWGRDWRIAKNYKIQSTKRVTFREIRTAFLSNIWNNVVFVLPAALGQFMFVPPTPLPEQAPALSQFIFHLIVCAVLFDFEYFVWHWLHHRVRWLYKNVHEYHHQYHAPSSFVTQYLHPYELITVGLGVSTAPWIVGTHCMTEWCFHLTMVMMSIEAHIGYDFPWSPSNFVPFNLYGGAPKHDMHHMRPTSHYQPFFNTFDRIFQNMAPIKRARDLEPEEYSKLSWRQRWFG